MAESEQAHSLDEHGKAPMKRPTLEEQRRLVKQWEVTGPLLERLRREELRDKPYDWREVDALLSLADHADLPERTTSGLVEQQRVFMRGRPKTTSSDEQG